MSRALRFAPPLAGRDPVVRPRLLSTLQSRFERPVTVVTAHAGFGKTTLLRQAVERNALSPQGADLWLTCQRDDSRVSFLAGGLFAALGIASPVPEDADAAVAAVVDHMWAVAPLQLALVLDDAHLIAPDSAGARLLARLVEELPLNGHVVLGTRPPARLPLARMLADGRAVEVTGDDLVFRDDELAEFAGSRGVSTDRLRGVGAWPGLAELAASVGEESVVSYVWEEMLAQFPQDRRQALGVLAAVGGADADLAQDLLGPSVDLDRVLDGLPLVVRAASGWCSLHPMWARALRRELGPAALSDARRRAGRALVGRRQYHDAMDLLAGAGAWDEVRALVVEVCGRCTPLVPADVLEAWSARLPESIRGTPEQLLLAGMVAEAVDPVSARSLLERASAAAPSGSAVRYACLNGLVQLAFWRGDRASMKSLWDDLRGFATDGHPDAAGWIALLGALLAPDPERVRAAVADPSLHGRAALDPVQDWLHAHVVLHKLGDTEQAELLARRALSHEVSTMVAVSRSALAESYRLRGRLDEANRLLPDLLRDLVPAKVLTSPELLTQAVVTLEVLGRSDEAAGVLDRLLPVVTRSPVAWAPIARVLAQAFHEVARGEEDSWGVVALRGLAGLPVVRNQAAVVQVSATALPLIYVLVPGVRAVWDAQPRPGCFAALHALARALVQLRETGSTGPVAHLSPEARELLRAVLPLPWLVELAVGLEAAHQPAGRALLDGLGSAARPTLRRQADGPHPAIATTARRLLREAPPAPAYSLRLRTLGPLQLTRDGEVVAAPELRRERVRQLLGFLVAHPRTTRGAVTRALWPDLEEGAGARNLRVTLAYLQHLLEPERGAFDPPYFLRSSGVRLELVMEPETLEVDLVRFEQHLREAERLDRQGVPSAALDAYLQATGLWRGDFLEDVHLEDCDWLDVQRRSLRTGFVEAAVRAGHLCLARGRLDRARLLGERALVVDPWSEAAYHVLASVALQAGDRTGSRRLVGECRTMLRSLGAVPGPRIAALARTLTAG